MVSIIDYIFNQLQIKDLNPHQLLRGKLPNLNVFLANDLEHFQYKFYPNLIGSIIAANLKRRLLISFIIC